MATGKCVVYKVVAKHNNNFKSSSTFGKYSRLYKLGMKTSDENLLFAYSTVLNAVDGHVHLITGSDTFFMLECNALVIYDENSKRGIVPNPRDHQIESYWSDLLIPNLLDRGTTYSYPPLGTVFCEWILPIKIIGEMEELTRDVYNGINEMGNFLGEAS